MILLRICVFVADGISRKLNFSQVLVTSTGSHEAGEVLDSYRVCYASNGSCINVRAMSTAEDKSLRQTCTCRRERVLFFHAPYLMVANDVMKVFNRYPQLYF